VKDTTAVCYILACVIPSYCLCVVRVVCCSLSNPLMEACCATYSSSYPDSVLVTGNKIPSFQSRGVEPPSQARPFKHTPQQGAEACGSGGWAWAKRWGVQKWRASFGPGQPRDSLSSIVVVLGPRYTSRLLEKFLISCAELSVWSCCKTGWDNLERPYM
jgi:hypothetical protein